MIIHHSATSVSPARQAAYRILRRVESGRGFAMDLLQRPQLSHLRDEDRRLATELVMGTLRWRGELDFWIERLSGKRLGYFDPEIATILRLGIYQIRFLGKVPKSAAVNEGVEMTKLAGKRSAAGLANAVLRKCVEPSHEWRGKHGRGAAVTEGVAEAARRTLPEWLRERWGENFGEQALRALALASVQTPSTTLRICRDDRESAVLALAEEGVGVRLGRFGNRALVVERGNVHASKALGQGLVVIQDEASQLVAELVAPKAGERVLDLCAAPGIKTMQLAAMLRRGWLVGGDSSARRLATMKTFLAKHAPPHLHTEIVQLDAARELPFGRQFDKILVDAPCSGTGTLARNPEIKLRLRLRDLGRLAELQAKILQNALAVLAPRGRLVYATCSLESEENEQLVEKVLAQSKACRRCPAEELRNEFPRLAALFDEQGYFRTRPDLHATDGFFAAVLKTS